MQLRMTACDLVISVGCRRQIHDRWIVIAFTVVAAATIALLAPHARTSSVEFLRLVSLQAVDSQASRRATTLALTPFAALSIGVSLIGLAVSSGGPGSGVTSLIALFLIGVALVAAHIAALRTKKV
jgi:hypothetical protein